MSKSADKMNWSKGGSSGSSGAVYFLGFVGALVYYMQLATNFSEVVIGFIKALIWPATIIYKLLEGFYGFTNL